MSYRVVCTEDWTLDQFEPYGKDITAAMKRLVAKFPDDFTVKSLFHDCLVGEQTLWLVLDGERFVSFALTKTQTIDATGKRIITLTNMAGEDWQGCAHALCEAIHPWCDEKGADLTAAIGLRPWLKPLKQHGYYEYAVIFRRDPRRVA